MIAAPEEESASSQCLSNPGHIEQSMAAVRSGGGDGPLVRQLTDARRRDTELPRDRADPHKLLRLHRTNLHSDCRFGLDVTTKSTETSSLDVSPRWRW